MKKNEIMADVTINGEPVVLSPMDVARILGVSKNTAYEMVHSKGFPSFMVGKQYRIRLDHLMAWMDNAVAS